MAEITLAVTQRVVAYTSEGRLSETQIALRAPSTEILPTIGQASKTNPVTIRLGGCIDLIVRDPGAIWRVHNTQQLEDFEAFFSLLARRPDREMRFLCEII